MLVMKLEKPEKKVHQLEGQGRTEMNQCAFCGAPKCVLQLKRAGLLCLHPLLTSDRCFSWFATLNMRRPEMPYLRNNLLSKAESHTS